MQTKWLPIIGLESRYIISNTGKVKNIETNHHVKPYWRKNTKGVNAYRVVKLIQMDGRKNTYTLSILVATHFVPNPKECIHIIHRDNNKLNCNAWNLRWIEDDVFSWINNKNILPKKQKSIGSIQECIYHLEKCQRKNELDEYLLRFYKTGDTRFLWDIFLKIQGKMHQYAKNGGIDEDDRHDIVSESYLYFIERCQRGVVNENVTAMVLTCLGYFIKTHHQNNNETALSPKHLGTIGQSEHDFLTSL